MKKNNKCIKKEVAEEYDKYIEKYSKGYTKEQLEEEHENTLETMLELKCEAERIMLEAKEYKPNTDMSLLGISFLVWCILGDVLNIPIIRLFSVIFSASGMIYIFLEALKIKKVNEKYGKSSSIEREAIFLELKSYVIEKCIMDYDSF